MADIADSTPLEDSIKEQSETGKEDGVPKVFVLVFHELGFKKVDRTRS